MRSRERDEGKQGTGRDAYGVDHMASIAAAKSILQQRWIQHVPSTRASVSLMEVT